MKNPSFILLYTPQVFDPKFGVVKPEGSLGLIYLAAALRAENFEVSLLDATVGNDKYNLSETIYNEIPQSNGMVRVGMQTEDVLKEIESFDVVGISSIFTAQTRVVEELVTSINKRYPEKLIILGGVNARSQLERFFNAGADLICLSEAELTIVEIGKVLRSGSRDFSSINGLAGKDGFINKQLSVLQNLDELPIPAWEMQPLKKYWEIARPHGSGFTEEEVAYASVMFSRGCPFKCHYCHISQEIENSTFGNVGALRLKSEERILKEINILKEIGVKYVFIEDDSLLAKKKRAKSIFNRLIEMNLELADVNGINLAHLCTKVKGKFGIDEELLELMSAAGFKKLTFPVESGSQRIIDKYATGKLDLIKHDVSALIKKAKSLNMEVAGNYTFGYPDESFFEMISTFNLARKHMDDGLDYANFMFITPFPGTVLYEQALNTGILLDNLDVADFDWMRPSMKTKVPHWFINQIITRGWRFVNKPKRINHLKSMSPHA